MTLESSQCPLFSSGGVDPGPPLVSIIIRSMARPTLTEALDSVAQQNYPQIEIVVVNALGAAHPLLEERCGNFPLRFIDQGQPLDRSAAANVGLDAAHGHYLGFLDDDDLLYPDHISALVAALKRQSEVRVAYSGVRMIAYLPDGSVGAETVLNQPFHLPSLRAQNYIPMHAVLFQRELLAVGCRFDERLALYEDWDFWLQLAKYSEFAHVDQVTACYRNFGHSGFGLHADAAKIAAGRAALFDKWRLIWSGAELSEALTALLDGVIHPQNRRRAAESSTPEAFTARLDEQCRLLQQLLVRWDDHRRGQEALGESQRRIEQLSATVQKLDEQLAQQSQQLAAVYQSTSWKITGPLRGLSRALRQLRSSGLS